MAPPVSAIEQPPIWALLVGVNKYADAAIPTLRGCVPDVEAVDAYLRDQLGVPPGQIKLLRDSEATYRNVLAAFESFLLKAPSGDQALVYFSCHGSQAVAIDPSIEADGLDETLVLHDSRTEGVYDLLDKELGYLLDSVVRRGLNVTVVLDACHSGSGTRDADPAVLIRRFNDKDLRARDVADVYGGRDAFELARSQQTSRSWINPGPGEHSYVVISGCRDTQLSCETPAPDGTPRGLLSYHLLEELKHGLPPGATYADLYQVVRTRVRARISDQEPQCEGDVTRAVFAAGRTPKAPPLVLKRVVGEEVLVEGGLNVGITADSLLLAFPPYADRADPSNAIARLSVTRADPLESRASVVTWLPGAPKVPDSGQGALPPESLVVVESYASFQTRNVFLEGTGLDAVRTAIEHGSDIARYLKIVDQAADAKVIVRHDGGAIQVLNSQHEPLIDEIRAGSKALADQPHVVSTLVRKLEHLAKYWFNRAIAPNPGEDQLSRQVKFELCRIEGNEFKPLDQTDPVARAGEYLGLRLTNQGSQPLYVSVWDFSPDWSVEPLYPGSGEMELLLQGETRKYPFEYEVSLPDQLNEGISLMKIFVTREKTNAFQSLRMGRIDDINALTKRGAQDAAGRALDESFFADLPKNVVNSMRGMGGSGVSRWGAINVEVKLLADAQPWALGPGRSVALDSGVVVRNNANVAVKLRVATRDQATRGVGADPDLHVPPALAAAPEVFRPLPLMATRANTSPALVLSVEAGAQALKAVGPDTPLELNVASDLVGPGEQLLAVAYDGKDYFLVGGPRPSDAGATVAVEWLPVPQDAAGPEVSTDRGLAHTVRLMFFKYTSDDIPGIGLRRAEVRSSTVIYAPVEADSIAEGARVLLCLHGITADSRSIVQTIGERLQRDLHYDHLLAFDYESFTTDVRANASTLWAALHDAGVRPGRGVQLDIVAHSMGGLVSRTLIELDQRGDLVRKLVMAGTPNGGSPLANVARFGLMLASYALLTVVPGGLSKIVGGGLGWLREQAVGITDLQTGSELAKALKNSRRPDGVRYLALAGTYLPSDPQAQQAAGIINRVLDGALDRFFDDENDLVVAAGSVLSVLPDCDVIIKPACDHSGYFSAKAMESYYQQLKDWLVV